jgi:glycerate-2-kinase
MGKQWIKNFDAIATSDPRKTALSLVNAALNAIDTAQVLASSVSLDGNTVRIQDQKINLARFQKIHLIGLGKAANQAAVALEGILGLRLSGGLIIVPGSDSHGLSPPSQVVGRAIRARRRLPHRSRITFLQGTHPMPSPANVEASRQIVALSKQLGKDDLVLVVVSGGGSSLLCWPESECEQGRRHRRRRHVGKSPQIWPRHR